MTFTEIPEKLPEYFMMDGQQAKMELTCFACHRKLATHKCTIDQDGITVCACLCDSCMQADKSFLLHNLMMGERER